MSAVTNLLVHCELLASLGDSFQSLWAFLRAPLVETDWGAWRDFWLGVVLDDRLLVFYALPLLPILLLLKPHTLRLGIVLSGLAFVGYLFGAFYLLCWLVLCVLLYFASEKFAIETRRPDVLAIGPPLAAWIVIGGGYFSSYFFWRIGPAAALNAWFLERAPWLFPMGMRGFAFEPDFLTRLPLSPQTAPPLFSVFLAAHMVGTAYLAVRMLTYFADIRRGEVPPERRSLLNFLAFVCYAPTLMQGPLERYNRYQDQIDACVRRRSLRDTGAGLLRIAWGLSKALFATLYFLPTVATLGGPEGYYAHPERVESYALLYFGVYIHIFWLYLEFSGYCDVAAGFSRILGYRLVENFNWPWLATSMRDLWRRWHISLSAILRDYLYIPLGGNRRHATLNICVTFALVGVWHDLIRFPQLAAWGVTMGVMVAVNQKWVRWMKKLDARESGWLPAVRRAVVRTRPLPQILCWVLTMHFFVHSLLIFFGGDAVLRVYAELIRRPMEWFFGG